MVWGLVVVQIRFVRGQYPTEVHMHVKRYHRSALEKHKEHMDQWCVLALG